MARPVTLPELRPIDLGPLGPGRAVCLSDIHLPEQSEDISGRLARFLLDLDASHLFLLGDIFDFWLGAAHDRDCAYGTVTSALKECVKRGMQLVALRGNRDFLAQNYLEKEVGAIAGGDAVIFTTGGRRILLTHGDAVCTWDSRYAAWRRICRSHAFAEMLGVLPLPIARSMARMAQMGSMLDVQLKPLCSMQRFESSLRRIYEEGIDVVVAGHIHRVGHRTQTIGSRRKDLYVVGGWETGGCHLDIEDGLFSLVDWGTS